MQVWFALEQETFSGLSGIRPKRLLAPFRKHPVLLFLGFFDFRGKFYSRNFLGNFGVFSVFSKDFVGLVGTENPW